MGGEHSLSQALFWYPHANNQPIQVIESNWTDIITMYEQQVTAEKDARISAWMHSWSKTEPRLKSHALMLHFSELWKKKKRVQLYEKLSLNEGSGNVCW